MSIFESIINSYNSYIDATSSTTEQLTPYIAEAAHLFAHTLLEDHKIFCCSSGTAFAVTEQFCANLGNSHTLQRPGLPAIFLGECRPGILALIDQEQSRDIYARPLQALAQQGDLLFVIASNGQEKSLLQAIHAANRLSMPVIVLQGGDNQDMINSIDGNSVNIPIPGLSNPQTLAVQFLTVNILTDLIEQLLFGTLE